jgi:hypothetical protein
MLSRISLAAFGDFGTLDAHCTIRPMSGCFTQQDERHRQNPEYGSEGHLSGDENKLSICCTKR